MIHTTNYTNTLILPSGDCKAQTSIAPTKPGTIAALQFNILQEAPYQFTSDDLLVAITAACREIPDDEHGALRAELFAKGQACLRASPLVKTHGWAIHHDMHARVGLVKMGTDTCVQLTADPSVTKVAGMRNKRG